MGNNFAVGAVIRFECSPGYMLEGPSAIECLTVPNALAQWNSSIPSCIGKAWILKYRQQTESQTTHMFIFVCFSCFLSLLYFITVLLHPWFCLSHLMPWVSTLVTLTQMWAASHRLWQYSEIQPRGTQVAGTAEGHKNTQPHTLIWRYPDAHTLSLTHAHTLHYTSYSCSRCSSAVTRCVNAENKLRRQCFEDCKHS